MILVNRYNRSDFLTFFRDKLLPEDFVSKEEEIEAGFKSKFYQSITFLGECLSLDLNVYEIQHTSEYDARVGLSRDAFKLISRFDKNNALILFIPRGSVNYRLSLVTIEPKLDETGTRVKHEYSNPKRFSFSLGEGAKTHTPEQYLVNLGRISGIEDLKKRFSVEIVNKEFYSSIAEMFSKLVGGKRKKGNSTVEFERQLQLPLQGSPTDQTYKEFAVRLIGRTVFCWFLKKKKSSAGIPLIPDEALSLNVVGSTFDFYHTHIEPLFFDILNTPVANRNEKYIKEPFKSIPFLNGGLFEPQHDDYYHKNTPNYTLRIPDDWWKEFLTILETYNFTIDENTTIDIDLSVDPEMLGRIFENLLAEINPETGETARKATGSYYTPRPIVEYMVDESLKQYLITKTGIPEEKLSVLLDYSIENSGLTPDEEKAIIKAFDTIKILDPACGSGAFPMGILQKMLLILQKVDHEAINSIQKILDEIPDPVKRRLVEAKLKAANISNDEDLDDYARKLSVIQRSIYGVDIQPIATDISKLRFFLSLIVDEFIQDDHPNRGIEPLPNLEFKFVCSNTLIPLPDKDVQKNLFEDIENIQKLEKIREDYFISYGDEKEKLKKDFKAIQAKMFTHHLSTIQAYASNKDSQTAKLISWNPFQNEPTTWFDAKWMFGVENGFNIILGNPPYIRVENIPEEQVKYFKKIYKSSTGKFDISYLFFEKGIDLLKPDSILIFISTYQFLYASSGEGLRKYLALKSNTEILMFSSNYQVFDNATTYTGIIKCKVAISKTTHRIIKTEYSNTNIIPKESIILDFDNFTSKKVIVADTFLYENIISGKDILFGSDIGFAKCGVVSSADDVFFVTEDFLLENKFEKELIYPILGAESLHRWFLDSPQYFCLYPYIQNGNETILIDEKTLRKKFPFIFSYFLEHEHKLKNRSQGRKNYEDSNKWYQLNRPREKWIYDTKKIIYPGTTNEPKFALDIDGVVFRNARLYSFILKDIDIETYKYLICILNSPLCKYIMSIKCPPKNNNYYEMSTSFIEDFPFKMKKPLIPVFSGLYDKLISQLLKNDNFNYLELINEIIVFKLYELNFEYCKLINPAFEKLINRKDYESKSIEELAEYEIKTI